MSRSTDPGHFFQTSDSLATTARKAQKKANKNGNPISLPSKLLAVHADPENAGAIYVAEAAGVVRQVVLETGEKSRTYTGPVAPVTCLAITPRTADNEAILFAGCWDKTIHSWSLHTRKPLRRYANGHADFVKCILTLSLSGTPVLISGGADAAIIVWDVATGRKLHVLKGHLRGILDLVIDPTCLVPGQQQDEITLFSASSDREIRRWRISLSSAEEMAAEPIVAHETSVNRILFEDATGGDDDGDADVWTASSDKTVKHLVRARNWEADTVLEHPDFVRDVAVDQEGGWVVTACRDEEVRVWSAASGEVACVYQGHYEEVTGLVLVRGEGGVGKRVVSVSIDGTVRVWSLDPEVIKRTWEEAKKVEEGVVEEDEDVEEKKGDGMLTAEEEAELAELMEDSD